MLPIMLASFAHAFLHDKSKPIEDIRGGTSLKVMYPPSLSSNFNFGMIDAQLANFGHI